MLLLEKVPLQISNVAAMHSKIHPTFEPMSSRSVSPTKQAFNLHRHPAGAASNYLLPGTGVGISYDAAAAPRWYHTVEEADGC